MNKRFNNDELEKPLDHEINSRVLDHASDIAEKLTELECKVANIKCYNEDIEAGNTVLYFTEEAQDIFDIHYDEQVEQLYSLLNSQLDIIQEYEKTN